MTIAKAMPVYDSDHNRSYGKLRLGGAHPTVLAYETMDDATRSCIGGIFYCKDPGCWIIRVDTGSDWLALEPGVMPPPDSPDYHCYLHYDANSHEILGKLAVRGNWSTFNMLLKQHVQPTDVRGYQYDQLRATGKWPSDRDARRALGLSENHWTLLCQEKHGSSQTTDEN